MKFFSLSTCQRFREMDLVCASHLAYLKKDPGQPDVKFEPTDGVYALPLIPWGSVIECLTFTPLDFLGDEPHAVANCKKLWPKFSELAYALGMESWLYHRHAMLDAPDQIEFIEDNLPVKFEVDSQVHHPTCPCSKCLDTESSFKLKRSTPNLKGSE